MEQFRDEGVGDGAVVSTAALEVDGAHQGERPFLGGGLGQRADTTQPGPHAARTREAEVAPGILHRDEYAALRGEVSGDGASRRECLTVHPDRVLDGADVA